MKPACDFGTALTAWAHREPGVRALVLFGSRQRDPADEMWRPDGHSDWDFQIIASHVSAFASSRWTRGLGFGEPRVYAARKGVWTGGVKIDALFEGAEANLIVIPASEMRLVRGLVALGRHRRPGWTRQVVQRFVHIIRPGWRFVKDDGGWEGFYRRLVAEVPDPRVSDDEARRLADGFACDYLWVRRKIARRELLAAQRMLHHELAEVNFRLLHEDRLRRGERSCEKARRIERLAPPEELAWVSVSALCEAGALEAALEKSAAGCRHLMGRLVGNRWTWPHAR